MKKNTQLIFKAAGLTVILIPIGILLTFAIAESVGGDLSGLFHLVQAIPFVLLAVLAWKRPIFGGWSLLVLAGLLLIIISGDLEPALIIGVGLIAFSGLLFLVASRNEVTNQTERSLYEENVHQTK